MCGFFGSLAVFAPTDQTPATGFLTHSPFSPRQTTSADNSFDPLAILDPTDHTPPTIPLTHSSYLTRQTTSADNSFDSLDVFAPTDHIRRQFPLTHATNLSRQTTRRRQFLCPTRQTCPDRPNAVANSFDPRNKLDPTDHTRRQSFSLPAICHRQNKH